MGRKTVYNAYCPTLNLADYGDTIEEVLVSIREAIELRLEVLNEEGEEIPVDLPNSLVTQLSIKAPKGIRLWAKDFNSDPSKASAQRNA